MSQGIAGVGSFRNSDRAYAIIYANGLVQGWPGGGVQRAFIHFELLTSPNRWAVVWAAIARGKDRSLDLNVVIWNDDPFAGTGSFAGPMSGLSYSETICGISKSGHRLRSERWQPVALRSPDAPPTFVGGASWLFKCAVPRAP